MKKSDVLLRTDEVLNDLYEEINAEDWAKNDEQYDKYMNDFFIISNILGELIQHRYSKSISKDEFKEMTNNIINHYFK